jgi:hypothetical protein
MTLRLSEGKVFFHLPTYIASLSICKCLTSIVDFIVMFPLVLSVNSRMVELRPTGSYNTEIN